MLAEISAPPAEARVTAVMATVKVSTASFRSSFATGMLSVVIVSPTAMVTVDSAPKSEFAPLKVALAVALLLSVPSVAVTTTGCTCVFAVMLKLTAAFAPSATAPPPLAVMVTVSSSVMATFAEAVVAVMVPAPADVTLPRFTVSVSPPSIAESSVACTVISPLGFVPASMVSVPPVAVV